MEFSDVKWGVGKSAVGAKVVTLEALRSDGKVCKAEYLYGAFDKETMAKLFANVFEV